MRVEMINVSIDNIELAFTTTDRRNTGKFQAFASRTRPAICRRGITFDLPLTTPFTSSHHLQTLMSVVLVHEHIILRTLSRIFGCLE